MRSQLPLCGFNGAGEIVDSCVFISVAFIGVYAPEVILVMIGSQILFKTLCEIVMYPITRKVFLLSVSMLVWSGLRSRIRRFSSYSLEVKWVPKEIGTPSVFLEATYELVGFGVEANGITGDIRPVNNADHLAFVHDWSFL